MTKNSWSTNYT